LFGFATMPALVFALSLNRIFDGVGRPFFGWLSDQIGREYTMALGVLDRRRGALHAQSIGIQPGRVRAGHALYFGVYGEIFSLFPGNAGRYFRREIRRANAGMLYTAKGMPERCWFPLRPASRNPTAGARVLAGDGVQRDRRGPRAVRAEAHARAAFRQSRDIPRGKPRGSSTTRFLIRRFRNRFTKLEAAWQQ
jgi:hypothetical protein